MVQLVRVRNSCSSCQKVVSKDTAAYPLRQKKHHRHAWTFANAGHQSKTGHMTYRFLPQAPQQAQTINCQHKGHPAPGAWPNSLRM